MSSEIENEVEVEIEGFDWGDEPEESTDEKAVEYAEKELDRPASKPKQGQTKKSQAKIGEFHFDLETVPDQARMDLFDSFLPDLPDPYIGRGFDQISDDLNDIMSGNVGDVEGWLKAVSPSPEVVDKLREIENGNKKPRKGVFDALNSILRSVNAYENAIEDRLKLLSTTPEFCSIAALGFAIDDGDPVGLIVTNEDEERDALGAFWQMVSQAEIVCGFNIIGFDLPVIIARSIILGVPASRSFDLKWGKGCSDIYLQRFGGRGNTDKRKPGKLKDLAAIYGVEVPAGDFHGGQVAEAMETVEGREKVREYVCSDVEITRELRALWLGYFC